MRNDGIFPITRIVAAIVIPFLFTAFVILFFLPHRSGELFAWPIKPDMSAMYFGSAYLGGAWLLANAAVGKEWHRVHVVFPAITVFTWCMLIATFLHWDKFSHGRPAFTAWLVLYMITPFLVPAVWLYNRRTDPRQPQAGQGFVSRPLCLAARFVGIIVLAGAAAAFLDTDLIIRIWPWSLTALTARVLAGWLAVIGVSLLSMASDPRWTAWRAFLESLFLAHVFIFIAAAMKPGDFKVSPFNGYTIPAAISMIVLAVYYVVMERRRRSASEK